MSSDKVFLEIPKKAEYFNIARLMISGLSSNLNLDIEYVEDIKMIVTECCNLSFNLNVSGETICIATEIGDDHLKISVSGISEELLKDNEELEISNLIVSSLSDSVEYGDNYILVKKYF